MSRYIINDLENYAKVIRSGVAESFAGKDYTENLDNFISIKQIINLIKKNNLGKDDTGNIVIDDTIFDSTFDELRQWFYEVSLAKLCAKNLVECAWDNKLNKMVFWIGNNQEISSIPTNLNDENEK